MHVCSWALPSSRQVAFSQTGVVFAVGRRSCVLGSKAAIDPWSNVNQIEEANRQTIQSALQIVGFDRVEYFSGANEKGHAFGAVQTNGNEALLAFRGTRPIEFKDIELDLELFPTPWTEGGKAHEGFVRQFG